MSFRVKYLDEAKLDVKEITERFFQKVQIPARGTLIFAKALMFKGLERL